MDGEAIFGIIMMVGIGFGMGGLFWWIGSWAAKRKDPMHFWSGSVVDPSTISDIPAYNQENARMWKTFSIPFWLTGVFSIVGIFVPWLSVLPGILIGVNCTGGIIWLVLKYNRILKKYKVS